MRMKSGIAALAWMLGAGVGLALEEGFEGALPDFHLYQATCAADAARAHSGARSLRVTPAKEFGGAYFKLDGTLDFTSDYEFTLWAWAGSNCTVSAYISASGGKERYTVASARGGAAGQWVRLRGVVRAKQWRPVDRQFMLALSTRGGESWFDDVVLRNSVVPDPAIEVWPKLESALHAAADRHATVLRRGQRLVLDASKGALAPSISRSEVRAADAASVAVPAEGLLTFAVDAEEPVVVTGTVRLEPAADLRPGLRAYVLSDATVVAAPVVKAAPWRNVGGHETGAAPDLRGERPAAAVRLTEWRLSKGRHYLTVAGPHTRPAGVFVRFELQVLDRPAEEPLYPFALFADTHLGDGRPEWMNVKMDEPAIAELEQTLRRLRGEGAAFAFIAGDMTDGGKRSQIESLGRAVRNSGLQVYGCIGNHETFSATSRAELLELAPGLFPSNRTDYAVSQPPLRFLVLDGSWWRDREGQVLQAYDRTKAAGIGPKPEELERLRAALAEDTRTPTIVLWHYAFYSQRGVSSCGYEMGKPMLDKPVMDILAAAPNVVATLNGHLHFNACDDYEGLACIQNAAFAEWPNAYRVFRVYADRVEWEVRQVGNRGFVSEGVLPDKALTWMLSVRDGDLAGLVRLAPRKRN
jgi:hypothetical protein